MLLQPTTYRLNVVKKSGDRVPFDPMKIYRSLQNVGVNNETAEIIIRAVALEAYDGITTKEIYQKTFALLYGIA